jgi:hypothetical protein
MAGITTTKISLADSLRTIHMKQKLLHSKSHMMVVCVNPDKVSKLGRTDRDNSSWESDNEVLAMPISRKERHDSLDAKQGFGKNQNCSLFPITNLICYLRRNLSSDNRTCNTEMVEKTLKWNETWNSSWFAETGSDIRLKCIDLLRSELNEKTNYSRVMFVVVKCKKEPEEFDGKLFMQETWLNSRTIYGADLPMMFKPQNRNVAKERTIAEKTRTPKKTCKPRKYGIMLK